VNCNRSKRAKRKQINISGFDIPNLEFKNLGVLPHQDLIIHITQDKLNVGLVPNYTIRPIQSAEDDHKLQKEYNNIRQLAQELKNFQPKRDEYKEPMASLKKLTYCGYKEIESIAENLLIDYGRSTGPTLRYSYIPKILFNALTHYESGDARDYIAKNLFPKGKIRLLNKVDMEILLLTLPSLIEERYYAMYADEDQHLLLHKDNDNRIIGMGFYELSSWKPHNIRIYQYKNEIHLTLKPITHTDRLMILLKNIDWFTLPDYQRNRIVRNLLPKQIKPLPMDDEVVSRTIIETPNIELEERDLSTLQFIGLIKPNKYFISKLIRLFRQYKTKRVRFKIACFIYNIKTREIKLTRADLTPDKEKEEFEWISNLGNLREVLKPLEDIFGLNHKDTPNLINDELDVPNL